MKTICVKKFVYVIYMLSIPIWNYTSYVGISMQNGSIVLNIALCSSMELGKCDDVVRGTCSGYYYT